MVDILAIDVTANPRFDPQRRLVKQEDVVTVCSHLIEVHPVFGQIGQQLHGSIHFIHLSVLEYLMSAQNSIAPIGTSTDAHDIIAQDCLSYLLHLKDVYDVKCAQLRDRMLQLTEDAAEVPLQISRTIIRNIKEESRVTLRLRLFAEIQWVEHAKASGGLSEQLFQLMVEAFKPDAFAAWHTLAEPPWIMSGEKDSVFGRTAAPLVYAIKHGLGRLVTHLLNEGTNVNYHQADWYTPLQAAAASGHLEFVTMLIEHGANVNCTSGKGESPLSLAASSGCIEVVEHLLDKGADVNLMGPLRSSKTPLMAAATENHISVARLLIDKGANVHTTTGLEYGTETATALTFATTRGHAVVQLLLSNGALSNPDVQVHAFRNAVESGHAETARLLLAAGIGVDTLIPCTTIYADFRSRTGFKSALQIAALRVDLPMVQLLLQCGAAVNLQTESTTGTALMSASLRGSEQLIELLIQAGAKVNIRAGFFGSAIHAACSLVDGGHPSVVRLLIKHGADIHGSGGLYGSPLRTAAAWGCKALFPVLLENGADVNQKEEHGGSALEAALEEGHGHAAHLLLVAGADRNVKHELLPRLQDVYRGIDHLLWRKRDGQLPKEDGTTEVVKRDRIPDGIYQLPYYCYFDKSLLGNPIYTTST
ncbi:MAG: hypothetical protein Q9176_004120 [Flavoplaca citrina]